MQLASSYTDCLRSRSQGAGPSGVGGLFDFLDPGTWFTPSTPDSFPPSIEVTPQVTIPAATPDSGFWASLGAGLPAILTAGAQAYTATQLMQNPAVAAAVLRPSGTTSTYNPYGIPSGAALPPGVTPAQYAYPIAPAKSMLSDPVILASLIGAGGLLLVALMGKR